MGLDFAAVLNLWPAFALGTGMTLLLTAAVLAVATPCAMLVAVGRTSRLTAIRGILAIASWIVRGTPPLLLLLIVFFIPADFGVNLPPFTSAVAGLSLYMAFNFGEVFRSGLLSVDRGQYQAADALGLSPFHTFRRLILPQMMPAVLPPYVSHTSSLLKNTSLATVVAIRELTAVGKSLLAVTYRPLETLLVVALIYAAFSTMLFVLQARLERRWTKR